MISVKDVYMLLDEKYPYCIQEDYDNSGIMADCGKSIDKIVISLDITNSVVDFAQFLPILILILPMEVLTTLWRTNLV